MLNSPDCSFGLSSLLFLCFLPFQSHLSFCHFCMLSIALCVRNTERETNRKNRYNTICCANGKALCTAVSGWHKVHFLKHSTKQFLPHLALQSVLTLLQCGYHVPFKLEHRCFKQTKLMILVTKERKTRLSGKEK